ncbi:capsular polysaccharide export protein, LipB/KpsS family [Roseobacter sp. HKCCD7870]|uniref:capsular polysaccharide export protein, LipB/KpsS family n=1 Tax=Roseobacter sp. HKCCD7870 TaxID=3120343 RepID=UPI0030EED790
MSFSYLSRNDNVLMLAHSQFRGLLVGLARKLKDEIGVNTHLYVATLQELAFYERTAADVFASISVMRSLYEDIELPIEDPQEIIQQALSWEKRLGTTFNAISLTDRHFGRGFALGGYRHPRSRMSETADYVRMLRGILRQILFWDAEIDTHAPKVLVNCGKTAALIGRSREIPYRTVIGARYHNRQHWSHDEFGTLPQLSTAFERASPELGDEALQSPYTMHMEMRHFFYSNFGVLAALKQASKAVVRQAYWRMRGYQKAKGYYLRDNIGLIWRRSADARSLVRQHSATVEELRGKRFVYFPLHMEPEVALQGFSPEFFSQLSAIASLSRDLPAGTLLAVKETIAAFGKRPRDFYGQIAEFKNVVMLRPDQLGMEVVKAADATATITGTGGFEAAVYGRPVISFGRHNLYNFLPHVINITREEELAPALISVLSDSFDRMTAIKNGRRFLNAVINCSFDLEDYRVLDPDQISCSALDDAYTHFLASFL